MKVLMLIAITLFLTHACMDFDITQMELFAVYDCIDKCKLVINKYEAKESIAPDPVCLQNLCGDIYNK
jgi:predicted DNA-binding protein YlxM (UPF0122 family)